MIRLRSIAIVVILFAITSAAVCQSRLPRVRRLDPDQPAGSSKGGCANHPMTFSRDGSDYFFDSGENGQDAWMNLDGKNVRLTLLRATLLYSNDDYGTTRAIYEYRLGRTKITVRLLYLSDYLSPAPGSVRLSQGKLQRIYRAFVAPQCDAL